MCLWEGAGENELNGVSKGIQCEWRMQDTSSGGPWVDGRELAKGMQDKGTQLKDKQ